MQAVICPVCKGSGKVNEVWVNLPKMTAREDSKEVTCHGCDGRGWVEVSGDEPGYPWPIVSINPYPWPVVTWSVGTTLGKCISPT